MRFKIFNLLILLNVFAVEASEQCFDLIEFQAPKITGKVKVQGIMFGAKNRLLKAHEIFFHKNLYVILPSEEKTEVVFLVLRYPQKSLILQSPLKSHKVCFDNLDESFLMEKDLSDKLTSLENFLVSQVENSLSRIKDSEILKAIEEIALLRNDIAMLNKIVAAKLEFLQNYRNTLVNFSQDSSFKLDDTFRYPSQNSSFAPFREYLMAKDLNSLTAIKESLEILLNFPAK